MSETECDHTSVGVIARDSQNKILLIKRANYPFGFAPPSGHCDGLSYGITCIKEFEEETGLNVNRYVAPKPIGIRRPLKKFQCKRPKGDYHIWQIFEVIWQGEIRLNDRETKSIGWYSPAEIKTMMRKTDQHLADLKLADWAEEESWRQSIKESIEARWKENPGLEPVWCEFFREVPELVTMLGRA